MKSFVWLAILLLASASIAWWLGRGGVHTTDVAAKTTLTPSSKEAGTAHSAEPKNTEPKDKPASTPTESAKPPAGVATDCQRVLEISSPAQRQVAFATLLASVNDEAGLRAILDVFDTFYKQGKRHGAEWFTFWSELVARDPKAAAALSASYSNDPKWQANVAGILAHEWAAKDPEAAIRWLAANNALSESDLDDATLSLISGYASKDVKAATGYALQVFPQNDPRFGDMAYILSSVAMQQGGPEGLYAWFDSLADDTLKQRLFTSVSNRLERTNVETRAAWLTAQAAAPYRNDQAYRDFVGAWAKDDPSAALAWVFSLPTSPHDGSRVGVGYAAFPWLETDLPGFTRYYQTLPQPHQQEVVRAIQLITKDPKFPERKRVPGLAFLQGLK